MPRSHTLGPFIKTDFILYTFCKREISQIIVIKDEAIEIGCLCQASVTKRYSRHMRPN